MINFHISNLISRLNNGEKDLKISQTNNTILYILDNLELQGFINYNYNPYTNEILIFNNIIKHIVIKSKPSRHFFVNKNIYKLNIGNFLYKKPINKFINNNNNNNINNYNSSPSKSNYNFSPSLKQVVLFVE